MVPRRGLAGRVLGTRAGTLSWFGVGFCGETTMPKTIDIEMLKKNPLIDLGKLEESQKLREEILRGGGVRGPRISPTPGRKRVRIIDDLSSDTRLVKLPVKHRF